MSNQDSGSTNAPFEMVTGAKQKKIGAKGIIIGLVVILFLAMGIIAGVVLVRQQQNISEKAAANLCPGAGACPVAGQPDLLRNCSPSNADGTPQEISCSSILSVGKISSCETRQYCCPSLGASWTTDLTLCSTPTPTPTITPTPISSASASPTSIATASGTPRAQATPREIPVTGTDWPTVVGGGVGVVVIILSILIAL